jgi:glycosyltransferase involved in cell wall biosynthesis
MTDPVKVSVLICTYNRCLSLKRTLESVAAQSLSTPHGWEIIVVDNNSSDDTRQVVESFCLESPGRFRYVSEPMQGLSNARNTGIRNARGEIIAFIDDDETAGDGWLEKLTANLHTREWAGAGGRVLPPPGTVLPNWLSTGSWFTKGPLASFDLPIPAGEMDEPPFGANMAFRKEIFEKYGGFRTDLGRSGNNLISNEDTEFGRRLFAAGLRLRYEPGAVVYHPIQEDRLRKEYFLNWWFNKGRSDVRELRGASRALGVFGIPLRQIRTLIGGSLRWALAISESSRLSHKIGLWQTAGEILEFHQHWKTEKQKSSSYGVSRSHPKSLSQVDLEIQSPQIAPDAKSERARVTARDQLTHIAFVTNTGEFGGAERHLLSLVRALLDSGVRLTILCSALDLYSDHLTPEEIDLVRIRCYPSGLKSFSDWYKVFREVRPDAVVFVRAWLWCYRWYVPLAAWLAGVPLRFSIAHLTPPPHPANSGTFLQRMRRSFRRLLHLWSLRVSSRFEKNTICVSDDIRNGLIKDYHFPAKQTITIRNGVILPEFHQDPLSRERLRAQLGLAKDEFLLVCVARLNEQKRIDILLLALAKLLNKGVSCKCIILGDGPLRNQLASQAVELGLSGRVFFEGFQKDPAQYLMAATAFVLTSGTEGLPLALLEAMACGLPCIVTKVGGNSEAITDQVQGLVVPPGSVDRIAAAIEYLLTHPAEREAMGKSARERVQEEFGIEKCIERIKSVILPNTR